MWVRILSMVLTVVTLAASASEQEPRDLFFQAIADLCGARFEGSTVFPENPGDAFRDQTLVASVASCDEAEIRIPFQVGSDRSRTWILRRLEHGLELKHDHRHEDGTPDEITDYGGTTTEPGTDLNQSFPADAHTASLIPEAATNEWFLTLSSDRRQLTYYLERHDAPRFKAILHRVDATTR